MKDATREMLAGLADLAEVLAADPLRIDRAACAAIMDRLGGIAKGIAVPKADATAGQVKALQAQVDALAEKVRRADRAMVSAAAHVGAGGPADGEGPLRAGFWREAGLPPMRFSRPERAAAFGDFCMKLYHGDTKGLTPLTGPEGGYLIPGADVAAEVYRMIEAVGLAARIGRMVPLPAGGLKLPRRLAGAVAYWKEPGAAATESVPTFGETELVPKTLIALVNADWELEEDSAVNLGNYLATEFAYAMAYKEDQAAIAGDGTAGYGGCTGLLNSDRVTLVDATNSVPELLTWKDLCNAEAALWDGATPNARWLGHRTVKAGVKGVQDNFERPLWQQASEREPANLMDYPFVTSPFMTSATGFQQASTRVLALGDFRQGLLIGRRGTLAIDYSKDAYWGSAQVSWRAIERVKIAVNGYTAAERAANANLANPIVVIRTAAA